jgi:hypothetical protein
VLCAVYPLHRYGDKLHKDDIRLFRVTGDLCFNYRLLRGSLKIMKAQLLAEDGATYVLPVLDQARLVKIEKDGLLLSGMEVIPVGRGAKSQQSVDYPQSWYCVPLHLDRPTIEEPDPAKARAGARRDAEAEEKRRLEADRIGASMHNMYSRRRG